MNKKDTVLDLLATAFGFIVLFGVVFVMLLMGGQPV